jgi:hypothetical protein
MRQLNPATGEFSSVSFFVADCHQLIARGTD